VERIFEPAMGEDQVRHRRRRWSEALDRARDWERGSTTDASTLL
jgi:hypothetical protein